MLSNAMVPAIAGKHIYPAEQCALPLWLPEMKKIQQGARANILREF